MHESVLDLDIGNSYTKWRLGVKASSRIENARISQLKKFVDSPVERVRVACVLDEVQLEEMRFFLSQEFKCEPEVARPVLVAHGMRNAYKNIDRLGVDRWLAALTAFRLSDGAPCLVVDIGSALTIDTIDDRGCFAGGYIIPGLTLMQKSLISGAGKINVEACYEGLRKDFLEMPSDTVEAVQRGASFVIVAAVEKAIENFLRKWGHGRVHITGGDGGSVAVYLGREKDYSPDLVLDGLGLALP